jgi:hypothetical protein
VYSNIFHSSAFPNTYTKICGFGIKIHHLATLVGDYVQFEAMIHGSFVLWPIWRKNFQKILQPYCRIAVLPGVNRNCALLCTLPV